jgi:hypothetical protein
VQAGLNTTINPMVKFSYISIFPALGFHTRMGSELKIRKVKLMPAVYAEYMNLYYKFSLPSTGDQLYKPNSHAINLQLGLKLPVRLKEGHEIQLAVYKGLYTRLINPVETTKVPCAFSLALSHVFKCGNKFINYGFSYNGMLYTDGCFERGYVIAREKLFDDLYARYEVIQFNAGITF